MAEETSARRPTDDAPPASEPRSTQDADRIEIPAEHAGDTAGGGDARRAVWAGVDTGLAIAIALAALYAVAFAGLAIAKHASFHSNAFDLGVKHQVTWNTAHGRWFEYTYMVALNPRLVNQLGDHVNLLLLPIAALYRLHDGPETLLVVQAALVASGLVALFLVARRYGAGSASALLLSVAYLLHPATQAALLFDFHLIVLAAPLFLWSYFFALTGRTRWLVASTVLLLACQENAALVVALLGTLLVLQRRPAAGLALIAAGATWFLICFFAILPALNPGTGSNAFARYRHLGATWWQVGLEIVRNPAVVLEPALGRQGRAYLWSVFAPFGFLPLLAPELLLCAASELALNLLSDFPLQRTIDYQYASVIVAAGTLAAIVGTMRLARFASRRFGLPAERVALAAAAFGLVATAAFQVRAYGSLRAIGREYAGVYAQTDHVRIGREVLARIPADVPVSAQGTIAPHLSNRARLYVFPTVRDAEYVALDQTANAFPVHLLLVPGMNAETSYREYLRRLEEGGQFTTEIAIDGWLLLRRVRPATQEEATASTPP